MDLATKKINKYIFFKYYPGLLTKLYVFLRSAILPIEDIEKYVPDECLMYDLGCGYGLSSLYLALKSEKRKIIGIDIDDKRINVAKNSISRPNLSFLTSDLRKDKDIEPCDCILICDLLHHIPYNTQHELLLTCKEKLKKSGILLIKEIDRTYTIRFLYTYISDTIVAKTTKFYFTSSRSMVDLLKNMGFKVGYRKLYSIWPYPHYLLICSL